MQPSPTGRKADIIAAWLLPNTMINHKDECDAC